MPKPTITHNTSLRPQPAPPAQNRIPHVMSFILGLFLSQWPLFITYLTLIFINTVFPINPNAPYHGGWIMVSRVLLFRVIQDLLTLLLILLTPVLARFKRTHFASYGLAIGLMVPPLFSYIQQIVVHILLHYNSFYAGLLPSTILGWLLLFKNYLLPLIGLLSVPLLIRAPKTRWLGYAVAVVIATLHFLDSPVRFWL